MLELLEYLKYEATFQSSLYRNLNDEIVKFNDGDFQSFFPFFFCEIQNKCTILFVCFY
jgi:hypothetical protein